MMTFEIVHQLDTRDRASVTPPRRAFSLLVLCSFRAGPWVRFGPAGADEHGA
jgi:hypothetical protein